jgi:hypothetical protein
MDQRNTSRTASTKSTPTSTTSETIIIAYINTDKVMAAPL